MMTSLKFSLYLLLSFLIATSCTKEEEPNVPCLGSFSCDINGEPFETSGRYDCSSKSFSYDSDQFILRVSGADCRVKSNGFRGVVFVTPNVLGTGTFPIGSVNAGYFDGTGRAVPHNNEVNGQLIITQFVADQYSKDYTNGYVEGTFWFTAYNEDTKDTAYVTNGQFCGRI